MPSSATGCPSTRRSRGRGSTSTVTSRTSREAGPTRSHQRSRTRGSTSAGGRPGTSSSAASPPSSDAQATSSARQAIHDATYTSAGGLRKGVRPAADVSQTPGARHPILRTHPVTRREALFLGRRRNGYVVGLPVPESERLLDALWAHATQPQFAYTHRWQVGDLVMWDNRCAMHRRDAFDPDTRRIMHRTQVKGDAPFHAHRRLAS